MIGTTELILIALVVLLIFGAGKLRNIGSDLGTTFKNFKEGMKTEEKKGQSKSKKK